VFLDFLAIASISIEAPFGRAETHTTLLAGFNMK
jgi:hypothetical protein